MQSGVRLPARLRPFWPRAKRAYTIATRVAAPINQRLSRAIGGYLPTGIAVSADDAIRAPGSGDLVEVAAAESFSYAVPQGDPPRYPSIAAQARFETPRQVVLRLPGGRVMGPSRAVITGHGLLIHEVSRYFGTSRPFEHPVFLHPFTRAPADVSGTLGVLATRGDGNYFHFMTDLLPRLSTLDRCDEVELPERWYAPLGASYQRELFQLLGIPLERIVDSDRVPHVRAECLVVPSVADLYHNVPPWVVAYLRERLLPSGPEYERVRGRRLYITRGQIPNTRRVANEDAIMKLLSSYRFEALDPGKLTVAEQIRAFAQAETIVAPHGSALTNLLFASPGASVVEMFAPSFTPSHWWKAAASVPGLEYRYLIGDGPSRDLPGEGIADDITVDPSRLERLLEKLWSRNSA